MLTIIANTISSLFHPMFMPVMATLLFFYIDPYGFANVSKPYLILQLMIHTIILPFFFVFMLKMLDFVKSIRLDDKQDRIVPFIATMTLYFWFFWNLKNNSNSLPSYYFYFTLGAILTICIAFVVNLFHKTSIHVAAISGLFMALTILLFSNTLHSIYIYVAVIIIMGLLASCRLLLKAHTFREVYSGFLIGISGQILAIKVAPLLW